jgi:hypothetical protein
VLRGDSGVISVDADVTDLVTAATSSAAGKVELATNAETVTGTSTTLVVTPDDLTFRLAAPGTIGGTTPGSITGTTVWAGGLTSSTTCDNTITTGFCIDADGDTYFKSGTVAKASGLPGRSLLYSSYLTEKNGAGWQGPASASGMTTYFLALPEAAPTIGQMLIADTPAGTPLVSTQSWGYPGGLTIASQAQGDVLYFNGTSWVRLAPGTANYFLQTKGAAANPVWALPSAGAVAFDDITDPDAAKTITLLDNNASAVSFGSTGKADIFKIITTDLSEGVTMSGTLSVTGAVTGASFNGHIFTVGSSTFTGTAGQTYTFPTTSQYIAPNSLTTIGDLPYANSTATPAAYGRIAAVAAGQVLASAGTGTVPVYTANPSITALTVTGANPGIILGTQSGNRGEILFHNASNNYHFELFSGASGADLSWTLPIAAPAGNSYLVTASTAGVLSYTNPASFLAIGGGTLTGGLLSTAVNAAGAGADVINLSGTLGIMDATGTDIFRGIYLNYTNVNHTGGSFYGVHINNITGDAEATELGVFVGTGWDYGVFSDSDIFVRKGTTGGSIFFSEGSGGGANHFQIKSPDVLAGNLIWTLPTAASGGDNYLLNVDADGTMGYTNPGTFALVGQSMFIGTTEVAINRGTAALTLAGITLTTPVIGAATGTSLLATGIVDGTAPIVITATSAGYTLGATYKGGYTFAHPVAAAGAFIFSLPTAVEGLQYCVGNYAGHTGAITVNAVGAGQLIDLDGTLSADDGLVHSGGAAGDFACFVGISATVWKAIPTKGTWTLD